MNYKSFKVFFFVLIFLTSKIGLALNVHYCGGHIEDIALAWNAGGCEISLEKAKEPHQDLIKNHCCQDQTVFIQNNEPQKTADYELQFDYFETFQNNSFRFDTSKTLFLKKVFTPYIFIVPKNKIFLLHQSFIFYG